MLITTLSETIRVLLIFAVFFFIIPILFMRKRNSGLPLLDRFFFGFICMVLFQVVSIHILVLIKLLDVLSIITLTVFSVLLLVKHDKGKEMVITKGLSKLYLLYDTMDTGKNRSELFRNLKNSSHNLTTTIRGSAKNVSKSRIFSLLFLCILGLSTVVRIWHSLVHYAYPHLDMNLHLKWIKAIMLNTLYLDDKIYPKAMHAVIAYLSKLTFSDPYWIVRYFGPFCSVLLVLSIYHLAHKITGNRSLALFAMACYGTIINNNILPSEMFRQTATMPQEFGMLFIILGFAFLIDYIRTLSLRNLLAFEACLLIALMSHSFSGIFLILWTAIAVFFALILRDIKFRQAVRLVWISALISILSFVPLIIGMLLGKVFHESSLEMVTDVTGIKISELFYASYFSGLLYPNSILMKSLVFGFGILLITALFKKLRVLKQNVSYQLSLLASTALMYLAYNIPNLIEAKKLPELMGKDRTGPFLSLFLPIGAAIFIFYLIDLVILVMMNRNETTFHKVKGLFYNLALTTLVVVCLTSGTYSLKTFYKHVEYDQAAEAYVRIKAEFDNNTKQIGNWYVVSTDAQFAQVKNYGWYEEGYNFAHNFTKEQVMDPNFRFDFPVNHIFIFVEKKPLFSKEAITPEYGETEIEPLSDDPFMQFYQDADNRAVMEGHIWMIADAYAATHDNVSIYYEDDDFMIYRIYQEEVVLPQ